jgi:2-C-methyl-D-erythritol 4-phosphate cytidylyltransferase
MQAALPKQYLPLLGRPVIAHTLERLGTHPRIRGVLVGISRQDEHWQTLAAEFTRLPNFLGKYTGGETRAQTVLNGLMELSKHAKPDDWVLVHDAVRPCVRHVDIDKLISALGNKEQGGLLAFPVSDTVKRVDNEGRVLETVKRTGLWRAATPQMFQIKSLTQALEQAMGKGSEITDEASAIEAAGGHPRVVACHLDNIKITLPEDIALAELYLKQQQEKG